MGKIIWFYNKMSLSKNLATNIRKLRGNLTQKGYAQKIGISQSTLDRIEKEEQNVTLKTLDTIIKSLKCKPSDLFDK